MKKIIGLSLCCASIILHANETQTLETINVEEKVNTKIVKDVSNEQIKSADLAEALTKNIPSISIVRRSGIANDIILRGQKKDNINILIDNAKIYGACPNRMDPPTSHILSNNIESVKVIEGPYDVENFGTLSGNVIVKTKEPSKEVSGEINLGAGSFGYKKASASISGGTDKFKVLVSTSIEKGDQYEDGNGNDFLEQQIQNGITTSPNPLVSGRAYSESNLEAFEKKTLLTKVVYNIDDNSEVKLSYTANRSDNVLYPNTPMDAAYDDSNIYSVAYVARDLGDFSKDLNINYSYSNVDHPMDTSLRLAGLTNYTTNHMNSSIWGTKIKNSMEVADSLVTIGLDTSVRNWKGNSYSTSVATGISTPIATTLASTDTTNKAIFTEIEKSFGELDLEAGLRYDYTDIDSINSTKTDRKYTALNANIFAIYNADENTKYFAGIGKSSRVPDARELYYGGNNNDLEDTKNYEADIGFEKTIGSFNIRTKIFYSVLKDYIYSKNGTGIFENVDAKIYGIDVSGFYYMNDEFSIDYGLAFQRGKKDESLSGQNDKDLAEVPPLKANIALNYEFDSSKITSEIIAVDRWDNYDSDNGEQELAGYAVVNLKYNNKLNKNFGFTLGVDNVLDKTYASTNTYNDIKYIGVGDTELLNDPGRYFYANLKYSF
ncbi:TonB-dependent receptor [Poseidonibacter parvus]|uniref:TonB-dependent receptor n=1 Tax=Poseidonibacter parvus TaxID=1850254 RepID=A0A1P8KKM6_9BACT|nr:TonB-dependent receptor [Poseidonibacter parvus]APW65094.1 TonB-dependent receptor [Poseidonibacter parvus]